MPLLVITADERTAAMAKGSSPLQFLMAEHDIDLEVQAVIYHSGFHTLALFAGLDRDEAGVRKVIADDFGLIATEGLAMRARVARLVQCWEAAREMRTKETELRMEHKIGNLPRPCATMEHKGM